MFWNFFQREGFEFYEYDHLDPTTVINQKIAFYTERFVEEVEQVRKAIGADSSNFMW
jgi:proline iminopeptidase